MLVEINLLPKKETKNSTFYIWLLLMVFITLLLAALFYWQFTTQKETLETTQASIDLNEQIAEANRQKLLSFESSPSVKKLNDAISWANNQKVDSVYIVQELTKNLPERGFIQELDVEDRQKLKLTMQFDTKREATYYLHSLLQISWVEDAILTESKSTDSLENKISKQVDEAIDLQKKLNFEPRHIVQYEVRLNVSALKTAVAEKKKADENNLADEEGEDSP